jgi:hypothetical protein
LEPGGDFVGFLVGVLAIMAQPMAETATAVININIAKL